MNNEILDIKVYGTITSGQQMIVDTFKKFLSLAKIPFTLEEVHNVHVFIEKGIESVPAYQVNKKDIIPFRSNGLFNKSLRTAITSILDTKNFGELPKITVPIDFSDTSMNAFLFGQRLATDLKNIISVLHAYSPSGENMDEDIAQREEKFDSYVAKLDMDWGSDMMKMPLISKTFKIGFPGEIILDSVKENKSELIVMGTTGNSGTIKKWFGSVSTTIMKEANVPVLLVPNEASYKGINKVLYAYDNYEIDKSCVHKLIEFLGPLQADIHFVHVNHDGKPNPGYYLQDLIKHDYPADKVQISQIESKEISNALNEYALKNNIDLIVMSTAKKDTLHHLFHKSMTKEIVLYTHIPVLVISKD